MTPAACRWSLGGRAGGRLRAGRHLRYDRRRLSDLMCSILNYAGMPMDRYGSNGTGPLADSVARPR